eukprot:2126922-Pyramimonas_sp.AAC.1
MAWHKPTPHQWPLSLPEASSDPPTTLSVLASETVSLRTTSAHPRPAAVAKQIAGPTGASITRKCAYVELRA